MVLEHTEIARKFYKSKAWKKTRQAYINSLNNGRLCEWCEREGKVTLGYIVDHIEEINIGNINDPDITLNHNNLQYLCVPCHNKKTFGNPENRNGIPEGCMFDENGQLILSE